MKTNYEVKVKIGDKELRATFLQTENGEFDLRYGWAEFTTSMHSSLESALEDFRRQLQSKHPNKLIIIGEPREISEDEAIKNGPNYSD